jgi:hypothetical protein
VQSIGDIHAQHDAMCGIGTGVGTRPPMSDNQQVVPYVSGFLTTRRLTDGESYSTVALLGTICAECEFTEERPLGFSSVAEDSDCHWFCQTLSCQKAIYSCFFSALMPQCSIRTLNGRRTA